MQTLSSLLIGTVMASGALGQTTTAPAPDPAPEAQPPATTEWQLVPEGWPEGIQPFGLNAPTMTDDWFGFGPPLREVGIDTKFFWNHHYMAILGGGLDTNSLGRTSATMDWLITLDLGKMDLIPEADMLMHVREQWGAGINPKTGANQQINDDSDGDRDIHIDQLWYRQYFFDRKLAIQLGQLDYQTIVDRNVYANSEDKQFMNAAFDNNPLIPTASQAGLGIAVTVRPCEWYTLILGIGDAQRVLYQSGFGTAFHDEAWFTSYMEHGFHVKIPTDKGDLPGNYRFGLVYEPGPRSVYRHEWQSPLERGDDYGWYLSFDQMVYRENEQDNQGLGAFFRFSDRHDEIFRFSRFWSGGLAYTGLVPTRDRDTMGFAFGQLRSSKEYRGRIDEGADNETIYELYYAIQLTPWLVLTPDIQYVDNPGGTDSDELSHVIAAGVKVRVTF